MAVPSGQERKVQIGSKVARTNGVPMSHKARVKSGSGTVSVDDEDQYPLDAGGYLQPDCIFAIPVSIS